MNRNALPAGAMLWPHLQRLAERWLRRWGYALAGLAMGLSGMWLAQPEAGESYAKALQAHAQLTRQLVDMRSVARGQTPAKENATSGEAVAQAQRLLSRLPLSTRPETLWTAWQQTLAAHDLRLVFLQPMPFLGTVGRDAALVSHAAAWRVRGRFDDWVRVWSACAERGPVCAIERLSVQATQHPGEVQIDVVIRVWMRSAEGQLPDELVLADWMAEVRKGMRPSAHSTTALFAPSHSQAADLKTTGADGRVTPNPSENVSTDKSQLTELSDDPQQWPLVRIRLAGLWRQGEDRQALVSAGRHAVRVTLGQRISLEGHQVVGISDQGVHLRLGKGPRFELPWAEVGQVTGSGGLSAGPLAASAIPKTHLDNTTGRPPQ